MADEAPENEQRKSDPPDPVRDALARILRPLVRAMIARGLGFPELAERLKRLYVEAAERHFGLGGRRVTDSRISLLTGLQRKDIRAQRTRLEEDAAPSPQGAGPLPRVLARWTAGPPYGDAPGTPRALPRSAPDEPSFEALVAAVSRDIHPRTVLDELLRLGLVSLDPDTDRVTPTGAAFVTGRDAAALAGYLGANLGDHAEAAVANLLAAPGPGPFFERAVHYSHLTPDAIGELDRMARRLQGETLAALNARALALQDRDDGDPAATGRFRCGAYVYSELGSVPKEDEA